MNHRARIVLTDSEDAGAIRLRANTYSSHDAANKKLAIDVALVQFLSSTDQVILHAKELRQARAAGLV